jgi:hypothetical protein
MPNCTFNCLVKHGRAAFSPGPVYAFEDADAVPYFVALGCATETADPADFTIPAGECVIDPETVFADGPNRGQRVLGD